MRPEIINAFRDYIKNDEIALLNGGRPILNRWKPKAPRKKKLNHIVRLKRRVFERDGYMCVYCGLDMRDEMLDRNYRKPNALITADHIIAKANGGTDTMENLVTACAPCNLNKGNKPPQPIEPRQLYLI